MEINVATEETKDEVIDETEEETEEVETFDDDTGEDVDLDKLKAGIKSVAKSDKDTDEPDDDEEESRSEKDTVESKEEVKAEVADDDSKWLDYADQLGIPEEKAQAALEEGRPQLERLVRKQGLALLKAQVDPDEPDEPQSPVEYVETEFDEEFLKDDSWDEEGQKLVAAFRQRGEKLAELERQVDELSNRELATAIFTELDEYIGSLTKAEQSVFGKGPSSKLTKGSPGYDERVKLLTTMQGLKASHETLGQAVPTEELFRTAMNALFGDAVKDKERKETANRQKAQVEKRRKSAIARPNGAQKVTRPQGDEAAVSAVAEKMRILNIGDVGY